MYFLFTKCVQEILICLIRFVVGIIKCVLKELDREVIAIEIFVIQ